MKRRTFCASAVSALTAASLPGQRALAALAGGEIPARGANDSQVLLKSGDVEDLRASLRGQLLTPGQEGYDSARKVWNGAFDRKPALIARCAGGADVSQAVKFARSHGLLVAVRGGGHSLSGQSVCDGGLMIDLTPMNSVRIDPMAKTARVEPGVLLGQFDREAQAFGLATTAGTVSHTGVAGLTLGGGFGRLGRKYGLACDNLIGADVISGSGQFVKTSTKDNADLLWGLRGGGGNFGVVTSFEYQLHDVNPKMFGGVLVLPFAQPREVLRSFADFIGRASNDLYVDVFLTPTPDGKRVIVFDVCHSGPQAVMEREIAALRKLGKPVVDGLKPAMYVDLQKSVDENFPIGRRYYIKSGFVQTITPRIIDTAVDYLEGSPSRAGIVSFVHHGGVISRVKRDATAFWHRSPNHSIMLASAWEGAEGTETNRDWVRAGWAKVESMTEGFYVNELAHDDTDKRVRANYGDNYRRLVALKKQYDPTNVFRMNANVKPDA
jgi:FAD/FMN-containing dehydrogenase